MSVIASRLRAEVVRRAFDDGFRQVGVLVA
jgi:hypothetical protein